MEGSIHSIQWQVKAREICAKHGVTLADVKGCRRFRSFVLARREVWAYLREECHLSYPVIGRLTRKDHSTIIAGLRRRTCLSQAPA
jgi:chromosomal replication initiation ATPase DnaA